jgi:poly-gamma-glutamate capsule biosynthesis protein CapA/YwtB (metallophosphatase superfamily)
MLTLFLCGDVMTGRGIDQVLPRPSEPTLHETYVRDARVYVELAERINGPIPRPVSFSYVWGDALALLEQVDARIVNLETSITRSDQYWRGKGINYRMHPDNVACLTAADIDCCVLANNHVLDWGYAGLVETLRVLHGAGLKTCGAGRSLSEAARPAVIDADGRGRVLVFAFGCRTSGIPSEWEAQAQRAGVHYVEGVSVAAAERAAAAIERWHRPGDVVVVSVHWGGNWGYSIPEPQRAFAHALIDTGLVDVIHGHSSHHAKGIEVYEGRPVIYGCGDFINDYEGIAGHEDYRGDLSLMYLVTVDADGLAGLRIEPLQMKRFRLHRAGASDAEWLCDVLGREGAKLGTRIELTPDDALALRWD